MERAGSGKSTLLHVLGCLQRPDQGEVLIEGMDMTQLGDEDLARLRGQKIGFVFQTFNLLVNVRVLLRNQDIDAYTLSQRSEEVLEIVELSNRGRIRRDSSPSLIQKLNDEGSTIVVSAKDSALAAYCQRAVRISEGITMDEGPVSKRRIVQASRIPVPRLKGARARSQPALVATTATSRARSCAPDASSPWT